MSRDVQPFSSDTAPFCSTTFHAETALEVGARSQRVPSVSCQVESAPAATPAAAGADSGAFREAASSTWMLPSLVAAATSALSLYWKTIGDVANSCFAP